MDTADIVIIGAGIVGASVAYHLTAAGCRSVLLLERESQPGYHSTGRSAAFYSEAYGNAMIRALTTGGRRYFMEPPSGFAETPLLSPRGAMFIGRADQMESLDKQAEEAGALVDSIRRIGAEEARRHVPVLRPDYIAGAVLEPDSMDIDVHAVHQGFLRGLRARGGRVVNDAGVEALTRQGGEWQVTTPAGRFTAPVLIDCAGAWCDEVAALAGAKPVGLVPKRRTVITFAAPGGLEVAGWPLCVDVDEQFYFKPDAGRMLASPCDETPVEPCDVQPDELDIALAVDRIEKATEISVRRIENRWAGLRSFVADKTPVVGYDPAVAGFFWLAGQGGYGIQTSFSMGRVAAALARRLPVPSDLADLGVGEAELSPARFA